MAEILPSYLVNTAPEIKDPFIAVLKKIHHFSQLSDELFSQLFEYSKFMNLKNGDRPIHEGLFGQEIYLLVDGKLEVLIKTETGEEKQIDVFYEPFYLFGEQCILGEQYNASVEAKGDVILIGIDLSHLPDVLDGIDYPENRLDDQEYQKNADMYTVFATALINRVSRLIKDQYKLMQKITASYDSQEYQETWKRNTLLTKVFNEFSANQLDLALPIQQILQNSVKSYNLESESLNQLISKTSIDTQLVYMKFVRLDSLGKLNNINDILMDIMQQLVEEAKTLEVYIKDIPFSVYDIPQVVSLAKYLDNTFAAINESGILESAVTKDLFLENIMSNTSLNPEALKDFLLKNNFIKGQFSIAYVMFVICQQCIQVEAEVNQIIAQCLHYLSALSAPRQKLKSKEITQLAKTHALVSELVDLNKSSLPKSTAEEKKSAVNPDQNSAEDLLAQFGL